MIAENVRKSNIGVGVGILLELIGRGIMASSADSAGHGVGLIVLIAGIVAFVWGCFNYSQGKGYPPALGLLGLLSCIGLIILIVLPDKYKNGGPPTGIGPSDSGAWPPPPSNPG